MAHRCLTVSRFPRFDVHSDSRWLKDRWDSWIPEVDNLYDNRGIHDSNVKKQLLQYLVGEETDMLIDVLPDDPQITDEYENVKAKLTKHFHTQTNILYERFVFQTAEPLQHESVADYHLRLRHLASKCQFENEDKKILVQMIITCIVPGLKEKALSIPGITLSDFLKLAARMELPRLKKTSERVYQNSSRTVTWSKDGNKARKSKRICCGQKFHVGGPEACPAWGYICSLCFTAGHVEKFCSISKIKI